MYNFIYNKQYLLFEALYLKQKYLLLNIFNYNHEDNEILLKSLYITFFANILVSLSN